MAAPSLRPRPEPLLDGLDPSQRDAVTSTATPLAILAGAGSGKTRVLTRRIAWSAQQGRIDPAHVLAVTFTRRAAAELNRRLDALGVRGRVTAGTFHALALALLRNRAADRGDAPPVLLDRKARLIAPILRREADRLGGDHHAARGPEHTAALARDLAVEIEWAKSRLVPPASYARAAAAADRATPLGAAAVSDVYHRYEEEKRRRGIVDFDDLVLRCAHLCTTDEEFAAVTRWRFRHVFVDEFQDVTPAQLRLVRAWAGESGDLCVVGDADQAIYGFAGAEPGALERFAELFPGGATVRLEVGYRSTPQIAAASRAALGPGPRVPVRTPVPDGPAPRIVAYPDDAAEAAGVARDLRRSHGRGVRWSSMAVLYRTNAQAARFEAILGAAGIPVRTRGGSRFVDDPAVREALDSLREAERAGPGRPFSALLVDLEAGPDPGPGDRPGTSPAEPAGAGTAGAPADRPAPGRTRRSRGPGERGDRRTGRGDPAELARLGREYLAADGGRGSVDGFVAFLAAALRVGEAGPADGARDAVSLLSFHGAKGLEFDVVHVTGVEDGLVPISLARTDAEIDEERRLLYVALSRAARELTISWARERTLGLLTRPRGKSPWMAEVELAVRAAAPAAADPGPAIRRLRRAARKVGPRGPAPLGAADPELYATLCRWRSERARAAGVPAHAVLGNAALDAVVTRRPRSEAELREIPGIGPLRAGRHGPEVLRIVAEHLAAPAAGPGRR